MTALDSEMRQAILASQRNEITEHLIYSQLAEAVKDPSNSAVLKRIANEERRHYDFWKRFTGEDVKPNRGRVRRYLLISKLLGLTFGLKLMENGEEQTQVAYGRISQILPDAQRIAEEEDAHEHELLSLIDEELLAYIGSMVLGLNDALVELTGALAGLTLALQDTRLIAMAGSVTGIAASFSMAASEYLSVKAEKGEREPLKAALYTGAAYIVTVLLLILPYLLFGNYYLCLACTMLIALLIILAFTFYTSVAQGVSFRARFAEMAAISLGVAALSFGVGYLIRAALGIEV